MNERPEISVVMSVYNGAAQLRETIDSILSQQGVSLEFIIVNDGSTDQSPQILNDYAERDARVRIIQQENQGLTKALIAGCAVAKGDYIARQDVGDISLPGKLMKQLRFIEMEPHCALASCGTRYVCPEGDLLYDVSQDSTNATKKLLTLELSKISGPSSHPSTIFSRVLYERVGGYRAPFYFAQDLDLWIRLAEQGSHKVMPEVLYQASVSPGTISGLYRKEQVQIAKLILQSAQYRRNGMSDEKILQKAAAIRPSGKLRNSRFARAKALYFIGVCLNKKKNHRASEYFKRALQSNPLHLKSAFRLLFG